MFIENVVIAYSIYERDVGESHIFDIDCIDESSKSIECYIDTLIQTETYDLA